MLFRKPRGSAMPMVLLIAVVFTGLLAGMAWLAGDSSQRTGSISKMDQAFYAAEAGAQRVEWYCRNNKLSTITSPLTGTINGYSYSVSWSTVSGTTIRVTSVGTANGVSYTLSETMTPPVQGAAISAGGNFDNKNIDVIGPVEIGGAYSNAGTGSITGDLTYYGSATDTGSISGTVTHASGSFTPIDMTALGNTLISAAGQTYTADLTNMTFDFSTITGDKKVIYVKGNVSNPSFVGEGTLFVDGTVSVGNFGTPTYPVNIVCTGDLTSFNNVTIYGCVYGGANWHRGKFYLTGMVYLNGSVGTSNYAQSTLTLSTAPWFDPRASSWAA